MRRFIDIAKRLFEDEQLIEAVHIPETDYGYWIRPDGEIIVVQQSDSHLHTLKQDTNRELMDYGPAFAKGWIRVVAYSYTGNSRLHIQSGTNISRKTLISITALAREPNYTRFEADVDGEYKAFDNWKMFVGFVTRSRRVVD